MKPKHNKSPVKFQCVGPHYYQRVRRVYIKPDPRAIGSGGPAVLYRCQRCGHKQRVLMIGRLEYNAAWVTLMEFSRRVGSRGKFFKRYWIKPARLSDWQAAIQKAAQRRDFPNLLFAERWIKSLLKAGAYPRGEFGKDGD